MTLGSRRPGGPLAVGPGSCVDCTARRGALPPARCLGQIFRFSPPFGLSRRRIHAPAGYPPSRAPLAPGSLTLATAVGFRGIRYRASCSPGPAGQRIANQGFPSCAFATVTMYRGRAFSEVAAVAVPAHPAPGEDPPARLHAFPLPGRCSGE